jgi:hypothetical protein
MNEEQKKTVLESHIRMKMKQSGKIKGRTVAGGNKQRGFINKYEASSPNIITESKILTSLIDAKEQRATATTDVLNNSWNRESMWETTLATSHIHSPSMVRRQR